MRVRKPTADLPPTAPPHTEPVTLAKLRRLADGLNDLAERTEAVGLTDGTRADASRLRLIVCHYARWAGLHDESAPPWAGYARDLLTKLLSPLGWCSVSDVAKHTDAEIVAALRRLSARMAKVAGSESEPAEDRGWTPEEAAEIVAGLRMLAAAVDCEPKGHDTKAMAARLDWALEDVYGGLSPEGDEIDLGALVSGTVNLLREIEQHSAPDGPGDKLRTAADAMEKVFEALGKGRQAEAAKGDDGSGRNGTRQKPPKKRTRRSKRPAEVLKEARERHAAKVLAQRPGITSRELGQELDCDASTVTRLNAWANRGVNDHPKPPKGFRVKRDADEGGSDIDAID